LLSAPHFRELAASRAHVFFALRVRQRFISQQLHLDVLESAKEFLKHPGTIFARELADVPGKNLVVVALEFPPKSPEQSKAPQRYIGHRHPGSVYVYVTKGAVRLGIEGQPVQVVHAGQSFFEPVGALHTVAESASATEPASAIAVLIVPDGAPILTPVEGQKK
jgi:quercetin dioxygenase-like cupin family protein